MGRGGALYRLAATQSNLPAGAAACLDRAQSVGARGWSSVAVARDPDDHAAPLVPAFDAAIEKTAINSVVKKPVETPFGYHVILRSKPSIK